MSEKVVMALIALVQLMAERILPPPSGLVARVEALEAWREGVEAVWPNKEN